MRLLNVSSIRLESHDAREKPYAILSHTWGNDEVPYADIEDPNWRKALRRNTAGWQKVTGTCDLAKKLGISHVWVDTCCIDKSSSAELSEAINSMFNWYKMAKACFAYLSDVTLLADGTLEGFEDSRWFTRGWTLQELLAPLDVEFFDRNWQSLGMRSKLASRISKITGIDEVHFQDRTKRPWLDLTFQKENVATRMSWAGNRQTARVEDIAYCLMGIFQVNMPLLYGEGEAAFIRLQEEISKISTDQSILVWRGLNEDGGLYNLPFFANSPSLFNQQIFGGQENPSQFSMMLTARGLELGVLLCPFHNSAVDMHGRVPAIYIAVLDCSLTPDTLTRPALLLTGDPRSGVCQRMSYRGIVALKPDGISTFCYSQHGVMNVRLDPSRFKKETIVLQNNGKQKHIRGKFPFKLVIPSEAGAFHMASYIKPCGVVNEEIVDTGSRMLDGDYIYGVEIMTTLNDKVFVVWWGLVFDSDLYEDTPRLWGKYLPMCLVQSWQDLTGTGVFDEGMARWHWLRVEQGWPRSYDINWRVPEELRNYERSVPWEEPTEAFKGSARPSVEYESNGLHVKAAMERFQFLGRELCQLHVTVV